MSICRHNVVYVDISCQYVRGCSYVSCQLECASATGDALVRGLEFVHHLLDGARELLEDEAQTNIGRHDVLRCQVAVVNVSDKVPHRPAHTRTRSQIKHAHTHTHAHKHTHTHTANVKYVDINVEMLT